MKKETSIGRENSQLKEKTPKEIRREERHRDREESSEHRKRDKDKRKGEKKVTGGSAAAGGTAGAEEDREYYNSFYDEREDRDRQQRDLSSVSNSSHGSPHREIESNERGEWSSLDGI